MTLFRFVIVTIAFSAAIVLSPSPWRGMLVFPFGTFCGAAINRARARR